MRIFPEPEVLSQQIEKRPGLFTFYTSCANFTSVALIVASESWCVKNNNNNNKKKNKNNSKEGTAESVKGQRAVAPLTLNSKTRIQQWLKRERKCCYLKSLCGKIYFRDVHVIAWFTSWWRRHLTRCCDLQTGYLSSFTHRFCIN